MIWKSYSYFRSSSCLYAAALGVWLGSESSVRLLPIPCFPAGGHHPSNCCHYPADRGGRATAGAGCCLQSSYRVPPTSSQHFQSLNWAHLFWSPPYGGEQLGARYSPNIFPEPNLCYFREFTTNQRMKWIKFR